MGARWGGGLGQEARKMPKRVPPLTQLQIKNAKPREKPYKLADGGGLYLEVTPSGGKHWRMNYRQPNGKENKLHFGASRPCRSLKRASGGTVAKADR